MHGTHVTIFEFWLGLGGLSVFVVRESRRESFVVCAIGICVLGFVGFCSDLRVLCFAVI